MTAVYCYYSIVDSADSGMYDCSVFDEEEGNLVGIYKYNVTSKSEHVT